VYRKPSKLDISRAAVIVYSPIGDIQIHKNNSLCNPKTFRLKMINNGPIDNIIFENMSNEVSKGVADLKKKYVLFLLP